MSARLAASAVPLQGSTLAAEHVFAGGRELAAEARALAGLIDPVFLAEAGWDAGTQVLNPPAGHRLLGRPTCRAPGCMVTAPAASHLCQGCRRRLRESGLADDDLASLPARRWPDRDVHDCLVSGCRRQWASGPSGLCRGHLDQRRLLDVGVEEFLAHPQVEALPACRPCQVGACPRQARHPGGGYCDAHQQRLRSAKAAARGLDEDAWRGSEPAVGVGGQVSLRGLAPQVVLEVLFGLQQRCRQAGVRTKDSDLRRVCDDLRRQQVAALADYRLRPGRGGEFTAIVNTMGASCRRALSDPETEAAKDQWDLALFGHPGTVSFTTITQPWLREVGKRWALDDLPKRKIRSGRRTSAGLAVRHYIGSLARLSQSLRARPDRGEDPAALSRADIETFLNRLGYLASTGQISTDARIRAVREVRGVLASARSMGLTRPGGVAVGLCDDFTIGHGDVPEEPEPAESGRDLPAEIMQQICARLDDLTSTVMRTGIELIIDTGRRPEEICDLAFGCLAHDGDGAPVLVFDNHKANRLGRRLPISQTTADVITAAQHRVRVAYPDTAVGGLKLLPTDRRNPDGRRAITAFSLGFHHRAWVNRMPVLRTVDGTEYDKSRIVLYAYRHSYAQRHADAGVPIDVLRELMDHRKLDTTSGYYQVGHDRRREAVDKVAAMQFDRHGDRVWRQAEELLDSERARRGIGETVVPFGVCTEPSNVQAGGHACPYRFRCAGCDHFRTDVSYLPDLRAHLDDLLRNRERLLATQDLEDWARAEALPSETEIGRIRRLISQVEAGLDQLPAAQRAEIEQAIVLIRRHRTVALGMPRVRQALPDVRPERP